jgi:hypothetical protein
MSNNQLSISNNGPRNTMKGSLACLSFAFRDYPQWEFVSGGRDTRVFSLTSKTHLTSSCPLTAIVLQMFGIDFHVVSSIFIT